MKILMISPLCPLPLEKGGAVRIWNIAKQLATKHELDLVCFIREEGEKRYEEQLLKVFRSVRFINRRPLFDRSALTSGILAPVKFISSNSSLLKDTFVSNRPMLSHLYTSDEMKEYILECDALKKYDLFFAETFYSISSLREVLGSLKTKLLLVEQNIESVAYARQVEKHQNFALRKLMEWDVQKIRNEERFFWKGVDLIGGLSPVDVGIIERESKRTALMLENGVDVEWFSQNVSTRVSNEILFVGTFSYFQNIDSLKWFVEEIWPKIAMMLHTVSHSREAQLRIVGRGADNELRKYVHDRGLSIDDSVDDIREAFQHASVLVAPIRAGSGTKYKVLEGMASRIPIVTTSVGAEGLAVRSGEELFICDGAEGFAEKVVMLLQDQFQASHLSNNAYSYVSQNYDWKNVVSQFEQSLISHL